jgi:hypothetical protein
MAAQQLGSLSLRRNNVFTVHAADLNQSDRRTEAALAFAYGHRIKSPITPAKVIALDFSVPLQLSLTAPDA